MDIGFLIEEKTRKLMQRLEEFYENQQVVQLDSAFVALTSDIITSYCYGESGNFLDDSSFRSDIRDSVIDATSICHFVRFFPFVISMITAVPTSVMRIIMPGKAGLLDFQQSIAEKASQKLKGSRSSIAGHETIYDKLVQPSIPAEERSIQRIQDESSLVLAAGTETTSRIITIAMFYLSTNKPMLDTLRAELKRVLPTPTSSTTWVQLEKLPYLVCPFVCHSFCLKISKKLLQTGVIRESLRLGHGITCRLPRVAPDEVLKYGAFEIQSGVR
jgi:cytochrome P450